MVIVVDDGCVGFDVFFFFVCFVGSWGFSCFFWCCVWWFVGLFGVMKNVFDVICKYYLVVVIICCNYYG